MLHFEQRCRATLQVLITATISWHAMPTPPKSSQETKTDEKVRFEAVNWQCPQPSFVSSMERSSALGSAFSICSMNSLMFIAGSWFWLLHAAWASHCIDLSRGEAIGRERKSHAMIATN